MLRLPAKRPLLDNARELAAWLSVLEAALTVRVEGV